MQNLRFWGCKDVSLQFWVILLTKAHALECFLLRFLGKNVKKIGNLQVLAILAWM